MGWIINRQNYNTQLLQSTQKPRLTIKDKKKLKGEVILKPKELLSDFGALSDEINNNLKKVNFHWKVEKSDSTFILKNT